MNEKHLFAVGTALTAVILAGHTPVCAASAVVSFQEDVFPIFKGRALSVTKPGDKVTRRAGLI